jgi:uncharacterized membrane protein YkgB
MGYKTLITVSFAIKGPKQWANILLGCVFSRGVGLVAMATASGRACACS